jgi:hypothetical protein
MKRTDLGIYVRAIPMLVRAPSILAAPLLGAIVALLLDQLSGVFTNPLGGLGAGIFTWIANVFYSFAFGMAIIQADYLERGLRGTFDSAWEETRRKAAGIVVAAIGFWFLYWVAAYIGSLVGSLVVQLVLSLIAAFFLIYTIPAAAIGGLPGSLAIGGSIRAVRANVFGSAVLAIAFFLIFYLLPPMIAAYVTFAFNLGHTLGMLIQAALEAIALGYLAFPFAKQYASVAFR